MQPASDEQLVARCLAGSDTAFAELVDRYKSLVFGVISQVVGDRSSIEDLAQEVFIKVHKGLPSFRTEDVMRRVAAPRVSALPFSLATDQGLYAGLSVAAVGVSILGRVEGMTAVFAHSQAAGSALIAAVAFAITWALTKKGPETEAS